MRGETEASSKNWIQLENLIGTTNPEKATGKRMASDCTHLEKRADLTERGNVSELWLRGTRAPPWPQVTSGRKRNGAGREWKAWDCWIPSSRELLWEHKQTFHAAFMRLAWLLGWKVNTGGVPGETGILAACGKQGSISGCSETKTYTCVTGPLVQTVEKGRAAGKQETALSSPQAPIQFPWDAWHYFRGWAAPK